LLTGLGKLLTGSAVKLLETAGEAATKLLLLAAGEAATKLFVDAEEALLP